MLLALSILAAFAIAYLLWQWRTGDLAEDPPDAPARERLRHAPPPSLRRVTPQRLDCAGTMPANTSTRDAVADR